ncbi:MAG: 4-alpha-glucanotransferase [Chloroflexi bacterium]|nr:4-alpha-glucanotransferase [Chloroflexota bacterium]
MTFKRSSGILLHPSSLPSPYGIGDLGPQAYHFVNWLASTGCKLWQVLPLGPTGYGDSPYQCFSAFAGNPYLISPDDLHEDGLLTQDDLNGMKDLPASHVDFGLFIPRKLSLLQQAFSNYRSHPENLRPAFDNFCAENSAWLDDYTLFMALKEANGGGSWVGWPEPLRTRKKAALRKAQNELAETVTRYAFYQFIFFRQWNKLRAYANERAIQIIGDIPIFVSYDSSDVWAHPELFFMDKQGNPTVVAGVPPDGFSATGQLWGNPLYNWKIHKKDGYAWWLSRVRASLQVFDILRFDHFRGFAGYYEIPADHKTAEFGRWVTGPGADLFSAIDENLSGAHGTGLPIIAEDLGLVTPDVIELLEAFNLPGMKVLQFGFSGPDNPFLPHNYVPNCVAYTGTHDNNTARGWLESAEPHEREFAQRYLRVDGSDFAWDLIRAVWGSVADIAITPMQDLLNCGAEARMNFPSRLGGNWHWRITESDLREDLAGKIREMNWLFNR